MQKRVVTLADLGIAAPLPEPAAPAGKPRKMVKEGVGDRGKYAEKEVTKVLEGWNALANFAFERLPDARAAGGRIKAQISDFMCWHRQRPQELGLGRLAQNLCIPLEVKSTEHKGGYLLKREALDQLPRLKKAQLAGTVPVVLVYFKAHDFWRVAPIDFFVYDVSSWNMSSLPTFPTAKAALASTGFFPTGR